MKLAEETYLKHQFLIKTETSFPDTERARPRSVCFEFQPHGEMYPLRAWQGRASHMERLITLTKRSGRRRWWSGLALLLLWFGVSVAHAASSPLNGAWREVRPHDTPKIVLEDYRAGLLKSFDP
ncbi:MAG: hypothetical protein M3Y93_03220, partial [Pseudomonadota bacterium]|nr:hypothetical protein [Pseudomonadota bacterium]